MAPWDLQLDYRLEIKVNSQFPDETFNPLERIYGAFSQPIAEFARGGVLTIEFGGIMKCFSLIRNYRFGNPIRGSKEIGKLILINLILKVAKWGLLIQEAIPYSRKDLLLSNMKYEVIKYLLRRKVSMLVFCSLRTY